MSLDDQEAVAKAKAAGYKMWGLSGERFLSKDSQQVLTADEVVREIEENENVQQTQTS